MAVVRTTAEERRRWAPPGPCGPSHHNREGALLAAVLAVLLLGLFLTYQALRAPFGEVEQALVAGRVVNLNELNKPEELLPFLNSFTDPVERSFVAERIWRHLTRAGGGPIGNVGELGNLRVPASEMAGLTLPTLAQRLDDLLERRPELQDPAVPLLSTVQLRQVKPSLIVRSTRSFRGQLWLWTILTFASFIVVHLLWRLLRLQGDPLLLPITALLSGLGLIVMMSVWDPLRDTLYCRNFAQGIILGCLLMLAASMVDFEHHFFRRLTFMALVAAIGLSALLILFGTGPGTSDARVNLFGAQPVEVVKVLVVLFLAGYFSDRWEMLRELKEHRGWFARLPRRFRIPQLEYVLPPLVAMTTLLLFFFLQRDLGPALVLSLLFVCLYGVARGRPTMAILGLLVMFAGFALGYHLGVPRTVATRIAMWLSPWDNSSFGGDHLAHSLWALATGGSTGTGLGLGQPGLVPAVHTDMVLAALGEELGFIGMSVIFGLYGLFVWRSLRIADGAGGIYTYFLALGLSLLVALQLLLIAGGVFGILPLSGVVTPFLSYGRSAMAANFATLGILISISARAGDDKASRHFRSAMALIGVLLAIGAGLLLSRAAYLQLLRADQILARGTLALQGDGFRRYRYNPRLAEIAEVITRGTIFDRNGVPLAVSDPSRLTAEERETLARLGAVLEPPEGMTAERVYTFGGKTFHLLGDLNTRVNWAASNTSFVERDSRVRLQGYDDHARVRTVRQPNGSELALIERDYSELIPLLRYRQRAGHRVVRRILERQRDILLSIDIRLQLRLASRLEEQTGRFSGKGAAVVMKVATGDLLASVSVPWPEGHQVSQQTGGEPLIDRARYGVYPPGSTFKILTAMAALRKDPGLVSRTFPCVALGSGRVGNRVRGWARPIRDDPTMKVPHGEVDLEKGIRVSCNAFFAQLGTYEVGARPLLETAAMLGITVARPN